MSIRRVEKVTLLTWETLIPSHLIQDGAPKKKTEPIRGGWSAWLNSRSLGPTGPIPGSSKGIPMGCPWFCFPLFFPPFFTSPTSKRTGHGGMLSRPPNSLKPVGQKNANSKVWGNKLVLYIFMSCFNYGSKDPYILFLLITEKTDLQNSTRIVIFWDLSGYESQIAGLLKKEKKNQKCWILKVIQKDSLIVLASFSVALFPSDFEKKLGKT